MPYASICSVKRLIVYGYTINPDEQGIDEHNKCIGWRMGADRISVKSYEQSQILVQELDSMQNSIIKSNSNVSFVSNTDLQPLVQYHGQNKRRIDTFLRYKVSSIFDSNRCFNLYHCFLKLHIY